MRQPPLLSAIVLLLSSLVVSSPASSRDCLTPESLREMDRDRLAMSLQYPDCRSDRGRIAARLREELERAQPADAQEGKDRGRVQRTLAAFDLEIALVARDRSAISAALDQHEALFLAWMEQLAQDLSAPQYEADELARQQQRIAAMRDVVEGRTAAPAPGTFEPIPDWTLMFGWCGTPVMSFMHEALNRLDLDDAWAAVGRDDLALQHIIDTQWLDAVQLGVMPPRLRRYGVAQFGEAGYLREVDVALKSIRIDDTPTGRVAHMPLLGRWLPVPLATRRWDQDQATVFETPDQIADYLRPALTRAYDAE